MRFDRIYIEVSNICNLKCHFCPEVVRAGQILATDKFVEILRQVSPYTDEVCLHVMGEPLAHPKFAELVSLCAERSLKVHITTNGTLLRNENVLALLSPHVRQVNISLQSFAANLLVDDDIEAKLNRYLSSIFQFVQKARDKRPDLYVQFRMWNQGAEESSAENMASQLILEKIETEFGLKIDFSKVDLKFKKAYPLGGRFSLQLDSRFRWPSLTDEIRSPIGFCHALTSHIAIHADGTVVPCCLDKEAVIRLGNIFESSFSAILKSDRLHQIKLGFSQARLTESLCQRCDFIKRFDKKASRLAGPKVKLLSRPLGSLPAPEVKPRQIESYDL